MSTAPIAHPSPAEFVARAIAFGLLAVSGFAAIVLAGAWWTAYIAALGLFAAITGLVAPVLPLADDRDASLRASRLTALELAAIAVVAIVVALVAA